MKIHEKAKLYDELLKDYSSLIDELKSFSDDLEAIPNRKDILEKRGSDGDGWMYYPTLCGAYQAMPFALSFKINKHESNLKWYLNRK